MSSNIVTLQSFSKSCATASLLVLTALLTACGGGGGGGNSTPPPPPATYTIGGTVTGLTGSGLVLQDNGGDNLTVAAGATTFVFATAVQSGKAYAVTVMTQPSSPQQTCTVKGGSGTVASSNVTNVSITCVTGAVTVGGTISGLTASGLVLQDNGADNLTVAANATTFTFATPVTTGAAYAVAVLTQPTGETCTVSSGSGTAGTTAVTTVSIVCSSVTVTVGGTITGLGASTGLVLQDNGGDNLMVAPNSTTFTFATAVSEGAPFSVSVLTQPAGPPEMCTVTGGTGTAPATNVTSVVVTCVPAKFTVGGTITGLTGTGLVLQDNGGDALMVAANATTFTFATPLQVGAGYAVSVATQPSSPAQVCTVGNGSGTIGIANVTTVTLNCVGVGRYVYVVNSNENGNGGDIAAFSINPSTGALTAIPGGNVTADTAPLGIAIDHTGQYAYVANKNSDDVSLFDIGSNGALSFHSNFTTTHVGDAAIAVAPSNQYVFTGGYNGPSGGAAWSFNLVAASGDLTNVGSDPTLTPDPLTSIAVDPTGSFVYASTGASTGLYGFSVDGSGNLTQLANSPFNAARGGNVAIWPLGTSSGGYVYLADNVLVKVSGFAYDSAGNLTPVPNSPINTNGANPQGITIDPTGTYLYVTNQGDNDVTTFSINAQTGALTRLSNQANTGHGPADIKVDPSNQFAYVVNTTDGTISVFSIAAGVLTAVGSPIPTGTNTVPVAIAIE